MSVSSVTSAPSLSELPFPPELEMLTSEALGAHEISGSGWSRSSALDRLTSTPCSHPCTIANPGNSTTSDHPSLPEDGAPPCTPSDSWRDGSHDFDGLDNWVGAQLYAELLDDLDVLRATGAKFLSTAMKLVVAHERDGITRTNTMDERVMEQLSHVDTYVRTAYHALTRRDRRMSKALRAARREDINRSLRDLQEKLTSARIRVVDVATRNAKDRREIERLDLERARNGGAAPYPADAKHSETSSTLSPCANTTINRGTGPLATITDARFSQGHDHSFDSGAAFAGGVLNNEGKMALGENSRMSSARAGTAVTPPAPTPTISLAPTPTISLAPTPTIPPAPTPIPPAPTPIPSASTLTILPTSTPAEQSADVKAVVGGFWAKNSLVRLRSQLRRKVAVTTPLRLVPSLLLGFLILFLLYYVLPSSEATKTTPITIHPIWEKARARKSAP